MKKQLLFIGLLILSLTIQAQDFNCDLVFWEAVSDTIDAGGNPAVMIRLTTDENAMNTGYTIFTMLNAQGDTLVETTGPHYTFPAIDGIGEPTVEHLLSLKAPFTSVGASFSGSLNTSFPDCVFELVGATSTDQLFQENGLAVFPNPFNTEIYLAFSSIFDEKVEVFDLSGHKIFEEQIPSEKNWRINTSTWRPGFYVLKVGEEVVRILKH